MTICTFTRERSLKDDDQKAVLCTTNVCLTKGCWGFSIKIFWMAVSWCTHQGLNNWQLKQ